MNTYYLFIYGLLVALIGTPLSYIAMKVELKEVNLSKKSWIRIFITFFLTGILAKLFIVKMA